MSAEHSYHQHGSSASEQMSRYIKDKDFACIFGRAAEMQGNVSHKQIEGRMNEPSTAQEVCDHLYAFIENVLHKLDFSSAKFPLKTCLMIFPEETFSSPDDAGEKLVQLLLNMHAYDKANGFEWAPYVSNDPKSTMFSYSIGGEAFFVPFLYEHSESGVRHSPYPALVFNWHKLFEELRNRGQFDKSREIIRQRTLNAGHTIADLLADYGEGLEFPQYWLPRPEQVSKLWDWLEKYGGEEPFG